MFTIIEISEALFINVFIRIYCVIFGEFENFQNFSALTDNGWSLPSKLLIGGFNNPIYQ